MISKNNTFGGSFFLVNVICLHGVDVAVKQLNASIDFSQILFANFFFSFLFVGFLLLWNKRKVQRIIDPKILMFRSIFLLAAKGFWFLY